MPLRNAPCLGLTHHHFSASPLKRGTCSKPSRKASLHPLPNTQSLPQGQAKELPPPMSQYSEEPGQLLTGSGLGHDPAAWHQLDPPGTRLPLSFPPLVSLPPPSLCRGTPPSLSPSNLTAALKNPSTSGQMVGPGLCPKSSTGDHL